MDMGDVAEGEPSSAVEGVMQMDRGLQVFLTGLGLGVVALIITVVRMVRAALVFRTRSQSPSMKNAMARLRDSGS